MRLLLFTMLLLGGCVATPKLPTNPITENFPPVSLSSAAQGDLGVLTWAGALCILVGTALMVIPFTSSFKGGTAFLIGVLLILLRTALTDYSHYIYIPVLVGSGVVVATFTYRTVRSILRRKKWNPQSFLRPCPRSSETCGSSASQSVSPSEPVYSCVRPSSRHWASLAKTSVTSDTTEDRTAPLPENSRE